MQLDNTYSEDKRFIIDMLMAHFPSTETLCSMLFPSCHEHLLEFIDQEEIPTLADRTTSAKPTIKPVTTKPGPTSYNSTHCFGCQFCMTGTMLIEHKFLLNQTLVDSTWSNLNKTLVYNLCVELCLAYPITYAQCIETVHDKYYNLTKQAIAYLIPNTFCPKYQFCEKYETPNILHCLKSYCMDLQGRFTFLKYICPIIPDHPQEADKYLNIRQPRKQNDGNTRDEL